MFDYQKIEKLIELSLAHGSTLPVLWAYYACDQLNFFVWIAFEYLEQHDTCFYSVLLFRPLYKTQVRELKEECEEKTKLCKELQQKKQELQDER